VLGDAKRKERKKEMAQANGQVDERGLDYAEGVLDALVV
jgi:hypothetical protein